MRFPTRSSKPFAAVPSVDDSIKPNTRTTQMSETDDWSQGLLPVSQPRPNNEDWRAQCANGEQGDESIRDLLGAPLLHDDGRVNLDVIAGFQDVEVNVALHEHAACMVRRNLWRADHASKQAETAGLVIELRAVTAEIQQARHDGLSTHLLPAMELQERLVDGELQRAKAALEEQAEELAHAQLDVSVSQARIWQILRKEAGPGASGRRPQPANGGLAGLVAGTEWAVALSAVMLSILAAPRAGYLPEDASSEFGSAESAIRTFAIAALAALMLIGLKSPTPAR